MASILVADDDKDTRDVLCRFLATLGHTVRCAVDGSDALQSVLADRPDLIISDLMMPGMHGTGLLEILRGYARLRTIPVILWTGAPDNELLQRVPNLNVSAVLVKASTTPDQIRQAIEQALVKRAE